MRLKRLKKRYVKRLREIYIIIASSISPVTTADSLTKTNSEFFPHFSLVKNFIIAIRVSQRYFADRFWSDLARPRLQRGWRPLVFNFKISEAGIGYIPFSSSIIGRIKISIELRSQNKLKRHHHWQIFAIMEGIRRYTKIGWRKRNVKWHVTNRNEIQL